MREQLLSENKFVGYIKYAIGEIILVVIGILIAFQLDEWSQNKVNKETASVYLSNISSNLLEDQKDLEIKNAHLAKNIEYGDYLIHSFKTQTVDEEKATVYLGQLNLAKSFIPNKTGMTSLINAGKLNLIQNDLIFGLQQYYSTCDKIFQREILSNGFIDHNFDNFTLNDKPEFVRANETYTIASMYKDDTRPKVYWKKNEFLKNAKVEFLIVARRVHSQAEKDLYDQALSQLKALNAILHSSVPITIGISR
jgi:hypothetical protein